MIDTVQQTAVVTAARDALSRAVRQALQTLIPTLLIVASGATTGIYVSAVVFLAAMTMIVSLLKSVSGVKAPAGSPVWVQAGERAVVAAAGTALGFLTVGGSDIATSVPWEATLTGTIGSAVLALVMFFSNPPVIEGEIVGEVRDELVSPPTTSIPVQPEGPTFVAGAPLPRRGRAEDEDGTR